MATLNIDRYHAAMGDASFKDVTDSETNASATPKPRFYITQRSCRSRPVSDMSV
jgi:hypothetical protein